MKDNLLEKLENMDIPRVEIKNHRENLRRALLSSEHFRPEDKLFWFKRLAPAGAALALMLFFGSSAIYSKILEANAMGIARNDSAIKKLNLNFDNARVTVLPAAPSALLLTAATATPAVSDKDERRVVEIKENNLKYTIIVNLTHREVEKVDAEDDEHQEAKAAASTPESDIKPEAKGNNGGDGNKTRPPAQVFNNTTPAPSTEDGSKQKNSPSIVPEKTQGKADHDKAEKND